MTQGLRFSRLSVKLLKTRGKGANSKRTKFQYSRMPSAGAVGCPSFLYSVTVAAQVSVQSGLPAFLSSPDAERWSPSA